MSKNIIDIRALVYKSLRAKALGRALAQLLVIDNNNIDKINNLQSTYRALLTYYIDGTDDPGRSDIINYLIKETYELTDDICSKFMPVSYCEDIIFKTLNSNVRYDENALNYAHNIIANKAGIETEIASAAIMISCLNAFDENKFSLLIELSKSEHRGTKARAITAIILCLIYNNERLEYYPQINNALTLLFDQEENVELAQIVIDSFLLATETDRISKEITENILPNLTKLAPEIGNDVSENDNSDAKNKIYKIQDKLEDSGIADQMRSYAELQLEGADINFSTFKQIKSYSFFSSIENWFMPFYKENKVIADLFENKDNQANFLDTLLTSSSMCDSDKYSLCLNIKSVSTSFKETVMNSLSEENEALAEKAKEIEGDKTDEKYINHYIQDIYRFFKLHKDHRYFKDIFASGLDIHNLRFFRFINPNNEFLPKLAASYYTKHLYIEAIDAYQKLLSSDNTNLQYYKTIGNCFIKLQKYSEARVYLKKADIIESDQESTLKKIALCNKKLGDYKNAEALYSTLCATNDNELSYLYNLAICQVELGNYKEALNNLYKLRFKQESVKESPNYNLYLGICLWSIDKKKEAVESLRHYQPLHELENILKEASYPFTNEEINFIIDYLRLN